MQSKTWVLIKSWVEEGKFRLFQREDHSLQSSASAAKLRQTRENPSPLSLLLFFSRLSTASTVLEARSLFKSFPRWCLATFHLLAFPRYREIHARQLEKELDFTASKSKGFFFFNGILRIGESLSINFTNFSPIASTTIFGERYLKWILLGFLILFTSRSFSSFFRFVSHARFLWNLEFLETVVTPEGRGGFIVITSSKVHSNVLESRVRLFLNGRRKDPFETTPPRRFVWRNHRPLKISRNRHAFNPSSNEQPLPPTQLNLPIISERILNYLVFETSDSSSVFSLILGPFRITEHQKKLIIFLKIPMISRFSLNFATITTDHLFGHLALSASTFFPLRNFQKVSFPNRFLQKILAI